MFCLMKNTCFFVKKYLRLSFAARVFFPAKSPYASEGKINLFGSQKHVFVAKTYLGFIYF